MKIMCKCGNIENLESDVQTQNFEPRNCDDGSIAVVCKKCNEIVFLKPKNN